MRFKDGDKVIFIKPWEACSIPAGAVLEINGIMEHALTHSGKFLPQPYPIRCNYRGTSNWFGEDELLHLNRLTKLEKAIYGV